MVEVVGVGVSGDELTVTPSPAPLKILWKTASTGYSGAYAPDIPPDRSLRCVHTGHSDLSDPDASFRERTCMWQDEQVLR